MGILVDFEEAKKKLFSPTQLNTESERGQNVRSAVEEFMFSRLPLEKRVFLILQGVLDNQVVDYDRSSDEHLQAIVANLLPYIEGDFLKPYVPPAQPELTIEVIDGPDQTA